MELSCSKKAALRRGLGLSKSWGDGALPPPEGLSVSDVFQHFGILEEEYV